MANRIPRFETHIRHLFRRLDRDRMLSRFDLWNADDVIAHADVILDRISRARHEPVHGEMPPSEYGGPWPDEWVDLFSRWKDAAFPRLEMPDSGITFSVESISQGVLSLTASGTNPGFGYAVWLEHAFGSADPTEFSLFREPPENPPPFGDANFRVSIDFKDTGANLLHVNGQPVPLDT